MSVAVLARQQSSETHVTWQLMGIAVCYELRTYLAFHRQESKNVLNIVVEFRVGRVTSQT
jgi:hypothetical protein